MPQMLSALTSEIDLRSLKRAAWVLAPLLALTLLTGDTNWLKASILTISLFITYERAELAPLGVACQALTFLLVFLTLLFAMGQPIIFVLVCALAAAAAVRVSAYGGKLRSLGNFTFIPALYLACETAEGITPAQYSQHVLVLLPFLMVAVLPVSVISLVEHIQVSHRLRHIFRLHRTGDLGTRAICGEAVVTVCLAVALAAAIVEWRQLDYGQWVIWSAASVVTGDMATARQKLYQRGAGALVGVPLGMLLGYAMPHSLLMYELLTVTAMLTLVSFSHYILGFGARCACIASAMIVVGQTPDIAAERVLNVLLGGSIGLLFVFLLHVVITIRTRAHI
ncbi:FUSC family protein [Acinetobacter sp. XS-4]|uniref:FUSC family protein n=1 Tax=Acinetobacter sp. XS-4 TaxID=2923375 RepID=UPI00208E0932|nr:FUSC family protein [Acinetobacter sp. XS-4]USP42122.1 FUSC family protein [Acinetobacter sp. XS-4]